MRRMDTGAGRDDVDALREAYTLVTETVSGCSDADFERPTRAALWTVRDLLFHLLLDAQRALRTFGTPTAHPADVDATTYWRAFRPGEDTGAAEHARFVRVASSAYDDPAVLVEHWRATAEAAVRTAAMADPGGRVATQGHVLTVPDFVDTLVVESTVHQLDLTVELVEAPAPSGQALARVRRVLTGLLGAELPGAWSDTEAALKGTGRRPLTGADRAALGADAARLPLFG